MATAEGIGVTDRTDPYPHRPSSSLDPPWGSGLRGDTFPERACFHCSFLKYRPQPPVRCVILPFYAVGSSQARVQLCAEMLITWIECSQG